MSLLLDALTILIILGAVWLSFRRGLVYSLIGFVGHILALIAAFQLSIPLGAFIYNHFLKDTLLRHAESYLSSMSLSSLSSLFGQTIPNNISSAQLNSILSKAPASVTDSLIQPAVQSIGMELGRGIAFVILFILFIIAVHIFERLAIGVSHIPVIGAVNRFGGAFFGLLKAFLLLFVICSILSAAQSSLVLVHFPLDSNTISSTYLFKYFYQSNPLNSILLK